MGEFIGRHITGQRIMLRRRLQVLADCEDITARRKDVIHETVDLSLRFAKAHHKARLGQDRGVLLLAVAQYAQGPFVGGLGTHRLLKFLHGLHIVVQHIGMSRQHDIQRSGISLHVGNQGFHRHAGTGLTESPDCPGKLFRTPVGQIVTGGTGHDDMTESQLTGSPGHILRFPRIRRQRPTRCDVAEPAVARTDISQDHEGRRMLQIAFTQIGTVGFLAYRIEIQSLHQFRNLSDCGLVKTDFQPFRLSLHGSASLCLQDRYG